MGLRVHDQRRLNFFQAPTCGDPGGLAGGIFAVRSSGGHLGIGAAFDPASDTPYDLDIAMYFVESLAQLAAMFVDEGVFGEIPEPLQFYIDHDAIARDLEVDFTLVSVAEYRVAYRLG